MDADHLFVELQQLLIFLSPRIGPPAVRVGKSAQAGLIAVINGRRAHPGKLDGHRLPEDRLVDALLRRFMPHMFGPAHDVVRPGQKPGMIMIGKLVHRHLQGRREHARHKMPHGAHEVVRIPPQVGPALVAVLLHAGQEPGQRLHERIIVHHAVPFIPLEPVHGIPVMLRQDNGLRIGALHFLSEAFPEHMVILIAAAQVRGHIKPPPVHIVGRRNPFLSDIHYILLKLRRILVRQLWQRIVSPPSVIASVVRPRLRTVVMKMKEIMVRTVPAHIGPLRIFGPLLIDPLAVQPFIK